MLGQYHAQRFRPSLPMIPRTRRGKTSMCPQENDFGYRYRVGTVSVGTIVYLQERRGTGVTRTPRAGVILHRPVIDLSNPLDIQGGFCLACGYESDDVDSDAGAN